MPDMKQQPAPHPSQDVWRRFYLPDTLEVTLTDICRRSGIDANDYCPIRSESILRANHMTWLAQLVGYQLEFACKFYDVPEGAEIHFCLTNAGDINAFAASLGQNRYCIVYSAGLTNALYYFSSHLVLANSVIDFFSLPVVARYGPASAAMTSESLLSPIVISPLEQELAAGALVAAMAFLTFHEITHILHGHLDATLTETGLIHEARHAACLTRKEIEQNKTSQALEFDADCTAVRNSIFFFHQHHYPPQCRYFVGSFQREYWFAAFGAFIVLHVLDIWTHQIQTGWTRMTTPRPATV